MSGREWLEHRRHQEAVERLLHALDCAEDLHQQLRQQEMAQGATPMSPLAAMQQRQQWAPLVGPATWPPWQ